jgi:hypothetical protein
MFRIRVLSLLLVVIPATSANAQRDRLLVEPSPPAEWGVTFSFQPRWDIVPSGLAPLAGAERDEIEAPDGSSTLSGSTWSIGFARGRVLGADWGVSFVQTRIRRDSVIDRLHLSDCPPTSCFTDNQRLTFREVTAIGPEVHFYIPFFTIKERVQVGIELAGGGAHFRGRAEADGFEFDSSSSGPPVSTPVHLNGEVTEITDEIFYEGVPWTLQGRIEPGVAVILSSRMKLHASAGFHYPGTTYFSLKTTYFFPRAAP